MGKIDGLSAKNNLHGLQNATVLQLQSDPENNFRVKVSIPALKLTNVWARLANIYATSGAGSFFYPEVGDEVLVGFINEDPRQPVILGALYSAGKPPPFAPDDKNNTKAIVSKSRLKIVVDEGNKSLTIVTPANNTVVLSDDAKSIRLADENGNRIEMNSSGITINSIGDITLKAAANVVISAAESMTLSAISIEGQADANIVMNALATAKFSSAAETIISGEIVLIN